MDKLSFPEGILAVDWWFYTNILFFYDSNAKFIEDANFFYRLHESNTAVFLNLVKKTF